MTKTTRCPGVVPCREIGRPYVDALMDSPWSLDDAAWDWPMLGMGMAFVALVAMLGALKVHDKMIARAQSGEIPCYMGHGHDCPRIGEP